MDHTVSAIKVIGVSEVFTLTLESINKHINSVDKAK